MKYESHKSDDIQALKVDVPCMFACPAITNVPEYIQAVTDKDFKRTLAINQVKNIFPGSLGRVCTRPCEEACRHGYVGNGDPVNICRLKRSGSDIGKTYQSFKKNKKTGKKVAIVGAGPAGLAAARDLLVLGHQVTAFEASDILGGMLPLAIPPFRLPKKVIDADIQPILDLGLKVKTGQALGQNLKLPKIMKEFDAVLLAMGCQKPYRMGVPGEDLDGVYPGLDFLIDVLGGKKIPVGKKALVIGGGYTAVDCARTLVRLGAENIRMVYRRTAKEISIDQDEMEHLHMEEVVIKFLTTVGKFVENEEGKLGAVELVRTKLEGGKVVVLEETRRAEAFDIAVVCIGQGADSAGIISKKLESQFKGQRLLVDEKTFMSKTPGLFGAGDYINATRSIIDSIGDGRKAALGIHQYLMKEKPIKPTVVIEASQNSSRTRADDFIKRVPERHLIGKKAPTLKTEVACGLNKSESQTEGKRCYLCNLHYEIDLNNCIYCMRCIDEAPVDCIKQVKTLGEFVKGKREYTEAVTWDEIAIIYIDNDICIRCGKCLDVCPTRCISVSKFDLVDPIFGETV